MYKGYQNPKLWPHVAEPAAVENEVQIRSKMRCNVKLQNWVAWTVVYWCFLFLDKRDDNKMKTVPKI